MVNVTDETGAARPEDVRHVDTHAGDRTLVTRDVNPKNPLNEPEINVRVRPGVEFFHQGDLVKSGDEFPMAYSIARAASMYVDQVMPDGSIRQVPHEQQQIENVPRANMAGMARHERIDVLEQEEKALTARLDTVRGQLAHERRAQDAALQRAGDGPEGGVQAAGVSGPHPGPLPGAPPVETVNAPPRPADSPAYVPGTAGAPGTTAVPARPGEPATGPAGHTPIANQGPEAKR